MKFGVNTQIWTMPFTNADFYLIDKVKRMGFGLIEVSLGELGPSFDVKELKVRLDSMGLEVAVCGVLNAGYDITSEDPIIREKGKEYLRAVIEMCSLIEARIFCGVHYAELGRTRVVPQERRKEEWNLCVQSLQDVSRDAEQAGVVLALEPVNRFVTDFINTTNDGLKLIKEVNSSHVKLLLDTFHMNIEEKNIGEAIKKAGKDLYHFHCCENDLGTPGSGHINWQEVSSALREIAYDRYVIIEGYNPAVEAIASRSHIYRPLAADQDSIAKEGLRFLEKLFQ